VFVSIVKSEGNTVADDLRVLETGAGWLPVGGHGLVRVSGKGHLEALQRVVSQDVLNLGPGEGALALLLAPKGQFRALMAVFAGTEQSYVLAPAGRGPELAQALNTYLLLSRCTAEPAPTADVLAVLGTRWREASAAAGCAPPPEAGWVATSEAVWFGETLLGIPGAVAAAGRPAELRERLVAAGTRQLSAEAVELARIRVGFPAWGAELTAAILPPEVGIEELAISYSKGCYVGQETIARMKTYGHATRGLVGMRQLAGNVEMPAPPLPLTALGEEKTHGSLTSWAWHPAHGGVALGVVRRELTEAGTRLTAGGREFEVTRFPLW
jgi:tRNA-modifying protein YgfZ